MSDNEALSMLTAMGFGAEQAAAALRECGGNLEHAANLLLSGGGSNSAGSSSPSTLSSAAATSNATSRTMIHCPLNQYSIDNGKSACTCIALTAAARFLELQSKGKLNEILSPDFLQDAILQGVQAYNTIKSSALASSNVEHLSAEDVLRTGMFGTLELDSAGVMQGMLSPHGPLGLRALIPPSQLATEWTCALITKPPETVVCCLPPRTTTDNESVPAAPFLLIDSHPRQHQFGAEGSYICQHASMESLIQSLETLFPPTDLGPDIPEMMAAMYNQFDLYRLRLRK